jgi:CubicO group peptidase (beta-lactamase class C family)
MKQMNFSKYAFSLFVLASLFFNEVAPAMAAKPSLYSVSTDISQGLANIEKELEERRIKYGIPGLSLVIVHEGKVIYSKGHGLKDLDAKKPVTPDTQFAIGSATKAFTGLSVLMSQDQKKLSLDDSPRKYLPYFKLRDEEANEKITVRDLLTHSSGLNRTDLAMITGKLNRQELIRVAGEAKPSAGFRKAFLYQNIMYAAAGEVVASVQKKSWEDFVKKDIFPALGMRNSTMTTAEMSKAKDFSYGYDYNFDTKTNRKLPFRDILEVAPAGSINSSANDMAKWLSFILNRGRVGGKRLLSDSSFDEWIKPQMPITANMAYGLGWFIQKWNNETVVEHGGNIDGFNSLVATIPEKNLGFALLTNVTGSPIGTEMMPIIWREILGTQASPATEAAKSVTDVDPEKEVGAYLLKEAGFNIMITFSDGALRMTVPGQPTYELQKVSPRKYKLGGAPDGFFITFKDDSAFLEQPQGNFNLTKIVATAVDPAASAGDNPASELIGDYSPSSGGIVISIKESGEKVMMTVPGQPPYELIQRAADLFYSPSLPDEFGVRAERDSDRRIIAITLIQPNGEFRVERTAAGESKDTPSTDSVIQKAIEALGGETSWRALDSRITDFQIDFENQGVTGSGRTYARQPYLFASTTEMFALGKKIGDAFEYLNSSGGGAILSFMPAEIHGENRLAELRTEYGFYGLLDAMKDAKASMVGPTTVNNEEVWVIEFKPAIGSEYRVFFSQKTYLPIRRFGTVSSSTSTVKLPVTVDYSDYRKVDGVMLPFRTLTISPSMGNVVTTITKVEHNKPIPNETFFRR